MSLLDIAIQSKIKKSQDAEEKAQKRLESSKINNAIIDLASK